MNVYILLASLLVFTLIDAKDDDKPEAETTTGNIELSDDPLIVREAYCESRNWIFTDAKRRELKWIVYNACEAMRYQNWEKSAKDCYRKISTKKSPKFVTFKTLEGIEEFSCQDNYTQIIDNIKECVHYPEVRMETTIKHPSGSKCYEDLMARYDTDEPWLGQFDSNKKYIKPVKEAARHWDATPGKAGEDKPDDVFEQMRSAPLGPFG